MELNPLLAEDVEQAEWLGKFAELPRVSVDRGTARDLELLGNGGYSPLPGFLNENNYDSVREEARLADGTPWSIPITLAVTGEFADSLSEGKPVGLTTADGTPLAILNLEEKYTYNKEREAELVYKTKETSHPGVARLYARNGVYLGGPVRVLNPPLSGRNQKYRLTPEETRAIFKKKRWVKLTIRN